MQPERYVENQIFSFLKSLGIFCYKTDSVGIFDPTKRIYRSNKNPHRIKGVSDVIGILPGGKFFAIEVKRQNTDRTNIQIRVMSQIEAAGGVTGVARNRIDAEVILEIVRAK